MKNKSWTVVPLAALMLVTVSRGDVVYQSDFTGTNLASAGLASSVGVNGTWTLDTTNDRATGQRTASNPRANLTTTGSWQSDGGFTLDVTFNQQISGARYSFGIVDAAWAVHASTDVLNVGTAGTTDYGLGFSAVGLGSDQLVFNNGSALSALSTGQGNNTPGNVETMSITVTPTSWSYSLNGQPATTGSMTFDTSRSFRFVAHAQNVDEQYISNITLNAVPEPATIGMLGLGAVVALFLRRRVVN